MSRVISLKAKILMFMGSIIIVLMMAISISVLYQWRALILESKRESALLVTQAFSVSILDALIYQESGLLQNEGYLENHIHNFLKKNRQVKFILVYDQSGQIIVRSSYHGIEQVRDELKNITLTGSFEPISQIRKMEAYGWVTEITIPLQIYGKYWGYFKMGFDSESTQAKIKRLFFFLFPLTIIVAVIILATIFSLTDRITKSLSLLVSEMSRFDLENDVPMRMKAGNDEIGVLVTNFEKMKQRLAQSRKQLLSAQRQIYHAEKLASIGRLASGVAHEINNPLNGVKNCLYSIEKEPENLKQTDEYLKLANEGLDHIALIIEKLLGFSRQQSKKVSQINLNEDVEKVVSLLQYRLEKNNIKIETHLAKNLPPIHADSHLIQEVIMNLLLNSFDSIDLNGKIRITTGIKNSDAIFISISDNGCGVPAADLDKIFDPFFTTKDEGKGTGLGLSVSLGIIEAHGGTISVDSKSGSETTFYITLPIRSSV